MKQVKINPSDTSYSPLSDTEKSIAFLQTQLGAKSYQIATNLKRNTRTIKRFLHNVVGKGTFNPRHASKGRWPKGGGKLGPRHKEYLKRWLQNGSMHSARQCWIRLNKIKSLSPLSYKPVNRYLKTLGSFVRPKLKSNVSDKNKRDRIKYCQDFQQFNFRTVLFTDECSFQLNANNQRAFRFKGHPPPTATKYNPNFKIMVWAGISYQGKTSLHFVEGKLKHDGYIRILKDHVAEMKQMFKGRGRWYFQQDGAPCHRPVAVKRFIKEYLADDLHPHPAQSPDLNPIELIWAQMKVKVEANRPETKQELRVAIESAWRSVTIQQIRDCIDGLPKKMLKIIDCNGDLL